MKIIDITIENFEKYKDFLPAEHLDDIGRQCCRALVGVNPITEKVDAAIFWEVRNAENIYADNTAEIYWYKVNTEANGHELLENFDVICDYDKVKTSFFELDELSTPEINSLSNHGFDIKKKRGINVFVTVDELSRLDIAQKLPEDCVYSLSDISTYQFKQGVMNCVYDGMSGLLDDLPLMSKTRFDQNISCCVLTDKMVSGFLLVHRTRPGYYCVELLYSDETKAAVNILNMLRYSIRTAANVCDPTDKVLIRMRNHSVMDLVKKLFPKKKGSKVFRGIK